MKMPFYLAYGLFLVGGFAWMNYRGWGFGDAREQKVMPTSIRQNPGSYRPVYGGYGGYVGGGSRGSSYPTGK